ncbi:DNA cytosine methyltransferase [Pleomorphomonas carboxyditropha]|uniref:DNA cytosine methyltransferase n=1 Tax=Pleomorphomonas carboxyditropha TaxID=2023338 RepID=UPI0013FDFE5D|nr:DNA (cytosine-5-)-methyltransferase [Pleomorphomonas carboxyditropha]
MSVPNKFVTNIRLQQTKIRRGVSALRCVDLFSGAGGLSLGLRTAGLDVVGAFDVWPEAVETYNRNIGDHAHILDLSDVMSAALAVGELRPDVICGGPPCQDFSKAGLKSEGERASMVIAFAMIVALSRTPWFMLENVRGILESDAWQTACDILKAHGYGISTSIVDASHYGCGQSRTRAIIIGRRGERDGFLERAIERAASVEPTTMRDILGDSVGEYVFVRPFKDGQGVRSTREPCPAVIRTTPERAYRRHIETRNPLDPVPASLVPPLTVEQVARLQGFPRDWDWSAAGNKRSTMQMIANAVPSPLAAAIGRIILERHNGKAEKTDDAFGRWLQKSRGYGGQTLKNRMSAYTRARRMLCGREFATLNDEIAALQAAAEFDALPKTTRSDLRKALKLHAEYRMYQAAEAEKRKESARKAAESRRKKVPEAEIGLEVAA